MITAAHRRALPLQRRHHARRVLPPPIITIQFAVLGESFMRHVLATVNAAINSFAYAYFARGAKSKLC